MSFRSIRGVHAPVLAAIACLAIVPLGAGASRATTTTTTARGSEAPGRGIRTPCVPAFRRPRAQGPVLRTLTSGSLRDESALRAAWAAHAPELTGFATR